MGTFNLEIITPEQAYPARPVRALDVPAHEGRLTVLPGHQPFICSLQAGRMEVEVPEGGQEAWTIGTGTLSVGPEGVTVLVQSAARA